MSGNLEVPEHLARERAEAEAANRRDMAAKMQLVQRMEQVTASIYVQSVTALIGDSIEDLTDDELRVVAKQAIRATEILFDELGYVDVEAWRKMQAAEGN